MTKLAGAQDMHMKPNKTITTMADFGFGPYAWLKEAADETDYVGINIANLKMGMTDFKISKQLVMGSSLLLTHLKNISKSKEKNMSQEQA